VTEFGGENISISSGEGYPSERFGGNIDVDVAYREFDCGTSDFVSDTPDFSSNRPDFSSIFIASKIPVQCQGNAMEVSILGLRLVPDRALADREKRKRKHAGL
jgi:hypothetical protein